MYLLQYLHYYIHKPHAQSTLLVAGWWWLWWLGFHYSWLAFLSSRSSKAVLIWAITSRLVWRKEVAGVDPCDDAGPRLLAPEA
eukprot:15651136-Heterocapsa_arctica.AAC.1